MSKFLDWYGELRRDHGFLWVLLTGFSVILALGVFICFFSLFGAGVLAIALNVLVGAFVVLVLSVVIGGVIYTIVD